MPSHDAIVIGAGLIGSAVALRLAQEGLRVALLEKNAPGREASWAAAGMLSPAPDAPASIPLVPFGRASLSLYPQFIAEIEEISGHSTGYRTDGAIELIFSAEAERELSTIIALHHALGLRSEPLPLDEAYKLEPALTRRAQAAAFLPYEASVDARALTAAVLAAGLAAGVELFAHTQVSRIMSERGRCTGVSIHDGTLFAAPNVVVAAGAFSGLLEGVDSPLRARPIRGQMVALKSQEASLQHVVRSERGYIVPRDSEVPQRVVTGSTLEDAGFDKRVTPRGLEHILCTAQELVPALGNAEVVELWCGLRPDTPDHLPLLGPAGIEGLTIATGHYRNGILLAPITAKLVREWIVEKRVSMDWELFNPLRFTGGAGENADDGDSVSGDASSDQRGDASPGKGGGEFAHK
jgi:glycine oxidase